jgi:uncharacterized membrane protein YqaE (UPF0057 family)
MKNALTLLLLLGLLGLCLPTEAAVVHPKPAPAETERMASAPAAQMSKKEERKLRREQRRAFRKALRAELRQALKAASSDVELILLVVIALLVPPLAMFLYDGGASSRFWISLILLGVGILLWGTLGALSTLASVLYTLYIIITESF